MSDRIAEIAGKALDCAHVSQHFDVLVACRACIEAALRGAVKEERKALRDLEEVLMSRSQLLEDNRRTSPEYREGWRNGMMHAVGVLRNRLDARDAEEGQ